MAHDVPPVDPHFKSLLDKSQELRLRSAALRAEYQLPSDAQLDAEERASSHRLREALKRFLSAT
jgi:hypothetical protein